MVGVERERVLLWVGGIEIEIEMRWEDKRLMFLAHQEKKEVAELVDRLA